MIVAGKDFHAVERTLDFYSHKSLMSVNITIINDEFIERDETLVIFLRGGTGVKLSPHVYTEVIIHDDDEQTNVNNDDDDVETNVNNNVKGIAHFFILSNVVYT